MASTSSKTPCTTCGNKGVGIFRCEGCLAVFCRKHLNEHRDFLTHQLDEIMLEHDTLQQTIAENKNTQNNQHPIWKEIDIWEQNSIQKIRQLAKEIRQQAKELIDTQTVSNELHDLGERLQKARIDDEYVEPDLNIWTTKLQKLRDDVDAFSSSIRIQEDSSQTLVARMCVTTSKKRSKQTETFGETVGDVHVEENGLVAIHRGWQNGNAYVRGIGEYSSGIQKIRFLFKKSSLAYHSAFGIVPKIASYSQGYFNSMGLCYGWDSADNAYGPDGRIPLKENYQDLEGQITFEIELQLDCEERKISYINQRTKNRRELNINITRCPFPWQIFLCLYQPGDHVRLLP